MHHASRFRTLSWVLGVISVKLEIAVEKPLIYLNHACCTQVQCLTKSGSKVWDETASFFTSSLGDADLPANIIWFIHMFQRHTSLWSSEIDKAIVQKFPWCWISAADDWLDRPSLGENRMQVMLCHSVRYKVSQKKKLPECHVNVLLGW